MTMDTAEQEGRGSMKEEGWGARMNDMNKTLAFKQCSVASVVK